ncbi:dynein heavy chain 12, axonemal-like [Pseudomyrmex gracilis]|uniref:dynein heavy chain 12, axonemal-like n=1 Tax=Pseudomyrmex gracilis TaxID=219809 RepID=UPI00099585E4|nr:dynein heavy chain 12, axonemal-like [Pseudomyrmex gracilis]
MTGQSGSSEPDASEITVSNNEKRSSKLHDYKLEKLFAKEIQDVLEAATAKAKRLHRRKKMYVRRIEAVRSQNDCFREMKKAAEEVPIIGLLPEWERGIRKLLVRLDASGKYADILEEQIQELKKRYCETMRELTIRRAILIECEDACREDLYAILPYKYPGRTKFAAKFFKNRCTFSKQYYLSHQLVRSIVAKAHLLLPEILCDFARYRTLDFLNFDRFCDSVRADLKKSVHTITASYYVNIARTVSQRRNIQDVSGNVLPRFLKCATTLLGLQIINRAINTIEHLLNVLTDRAAMPFLTFELKCENRDLFASPRLEELHNIFHDFVNEIATSGRHLPPLETWVHSRRYQGRGGREERRKGGKREKGQTELNIAANSNPAFVSLPDWYLNKAHERLTASLQEFFRPLCDYVAELRLKFDCILHVEDNEQLDAMAATKRFKKEHTLEQCMERVKDFNDLIRAIHGMPDNEYLETMRVHQVAAKHGLIYFANRSRDIVIDELVERHWNYNLDICNTFEELRDRALDVPQTTKELLELGQYMLAATSTVLMELQEKMYLSLRMLTSLLEMTSLSRHHIELNTTTVQWFKRIKPIFERSSSMYEQMKFDLEEKLQEEVEILSHRVEGMFPRLVIMNDMDDAKRVKEYIELMWKMMRELERMKQKAESINAEEALFQFPLTAYPRINELRENILPFYNVIYKGYRWQRNREVWLNSSFEYLDIDHIENKCKEYFHDFNKTSKLYRTKIKIQLATNYPYSFGGYVDDPDPFQHPAPLKLCHQFLEEVRWFMQYIPLLAIFLDPTMTQPLWDKMSVIAGVDLTPDAGMSLRKLIAMNLNREDLERVPMERLFWNLLESKLEETGWGVPDEEEEHEEEDEDEEDQILRNETPI